MSKLSTLINFVDHCEKSLEDEKASFSDKLVNSLAMNYAPKESTIKSILNFSKSFSTISTNSLGYVDLNFN